MSESDKHQMNLSALFCHNTQAQSKDAVIHHHPHYSAVEQATTNFLLVNRLVAKEVMAS